jgi:hypothetical protein
MGIGEPLAEKRPDQAIGDRRSVCIQPDRIYFPFMIVARTSSGVSVGGKFDSYGGQEI